MYNRVHVCGHKYVFGRLYARGKMSSEEGRKYIYAKEHQLYYYYINFKVQLLYKKKLN